MVDQREFTVRVEDEEGGVLAGLSGWSWGPVAGISMVWVREKERGSGWGARLLDAAEGVARERGCTRIFVSSAIFQAPSSDASQGSVEIARIRDYPLDGAADVYWVKALP